jgi:DNA-binding MarR family transcriptional regulator
MDTLLELLRCTRMVEGHLSIEFGAVRLAPLHGHLLVVLLRDGPSSFRRLLDRVGCSDSTLSSAIRALEDRGFLRRVRDPGRWTTTHFTLTQPGEQLAAFVWSAMTATSWRLQVLTEGDGERVMQRIVRATDDALRDDRGRGPYERRSHRRREDPLLE